VLASHARMLRGLLGAPVERTWLACRLASPEAPGVLRDTLSPCTGVIPVPAGHFAEITGTRCRTVRWWTPPPAALPLIARNRPGVVAVRDSKDPDGPALVFSAQEWRAFTAGVADDEFTV
jgi:Domain of unknown function (DUF397)